MHERPKYIDYRMFSNVTSRDGGEAGRGTTSCLGCFAIVAGALALGAIAALIR